MPLCAGVKTWDLEHFMDRLAGRFAGYRTPGARSPQKCGAHLHNTNVHGLHPQALLSWHNDKRQVNGNCHTPNVIPWAAGFGVVWGNQSKDILW